MGFWDNLFGELKELAEEVKEGTKKSFEDAWRDRHEINKPTYDGLKETVKDAWDKTKNQLDD